MTSDTKGCTNDSTETHQFGLDDILIKIGQFGKFQLCLFLLMFVLVIFSTVVTVGFAFTASTVAYRCRIPECDESENIYEKPWTQFAIPKTASGVLEKCKRYRIFNSTSGNHYCNAENFDQEVKEDCGYNDGFIFRDNEVTVSNDFGIFCEDEWKLSMAGTIYNVGQFIGIPLGGYFSDRYGRRTVLGCGAFLSAVMGVLRSFAPNYYIFIICGFLDNLFGSSLYAIVFVLGLELVGPKIRVPACTAITMCGGLGGFLLALAAKTFKNWRLIERIFYVPALGFIALLWILPESVRWLLSQGEEEKATQILKKAAKVNKRKLSDASIEKLLLANRLSLEGSDTETKFPIFEAFKCFPWRIINCCLCWFTNVLVFFGLSLNSALLGGNKYNSFMYITLIEIPGVMLPFLTMNRYGRRYSLFGYLFMCGVFITGTAFVSPDSVGLHLILFLLAKMAISGSFQVVYFFTSEIFPTSVRNSLLSFCSMFGRFGSMLAPQTLLMAKYYASAPAILFASCAFLSGFLAFLLPETKGLVLPTTLKEAQQIGKKEKHLEEEAEETEEKLLESKV